MKSKGWKKMIFLKSFVVENINILKFPLFQNDKFIYTQESNLDDQNYRFCVFSKFRKL